MTTEQRIEYYMMSNRRNLAELMVHREDEYKETLKTQHDLMVSGEKRGVDKATDDFESREKELTNRLDNAKKRYESKCQELDDCSAFSTKQALDINDFESRTCGSCRYNYELHGNVNYCSLLEQDNMKHCSEFERKDK